MSVISNLSVALSCSGNNVKVSDFAEVNSPVTYGSAVSYANGTGASQADKVYAKTRTLTASSTEDLDMAGVLVDELGQAVTFARIKAILVFAAAANTNNVNVIRPATNGVPLFLAVSDGVSVRPGGFFALACGDVTGYPVTAATADLITFTNSAAGTSVTYTVVLIGSSA